MTEYRKWRAYFVACTLRGLKVHLPALRIAYRHNYSPAEMAAQVIAAFQWKTIGQYERAEAELVQNGIKAAGVEPRIGA